MNALRVLLGLTTGLLSSCGTPPVVEMPPLPALPDGIGRFGITFVGDSDCPDVAGKFVSPPELITLTHGDEKRSAGSRIDFHSVFPVHIADAKSFGIQRMRGETGVLVVDQPSGNRLIVQEVTMADQIVSSFEFNRDEGDFECELGFIRFPATYHYGVGEDVTLNGQSVKRVRLTQDGDLVGINSWGPYRSYRKNAHSKFVHEFYKFSKVD